MAQMALCASCAPQCPSQLLLPAGAPLSSGWAESLSQPMSTTSWPPAVQMSHSSSSSMCISTCSSVLRTALPSSTCAARPAALQMGVTMRETLRTPPSPHSSPWQRVCVQQVTFSGAWAAQRSKAPARQPERQHAFGRRAARLLAKLARVLRSGCAASACCAPLALHNSPARAPLALLGRRAALRAFLLIW